MYIAKKNEKINTKKELSFLIEYISKRWTANDELEPLMTDVWNTALKEYKNNFNMHDVYLAGIDFSNKREDEKLWPQIDKKRLPMLKYYDAVSKIGRAISDESRKVHQALEKNWSYSFTENLTHDIKNKFNTSQLKPLGWNKLAKNYVDFAGQNEYCENQQDIDDEEFKGCYSQTGSSFGFQTSTALPYVMYDNKCQGRKPLEVLVGAIVSHAYRVVEHNNTIDLINEISRIEKIFQSPQYSKEIIYQVDTDKITDNKILNAIFKLSKKDEKQEPKDEWDKTIENIFFCKEAFQEITQEQKEKNRKEIALMLSTMLTNARNPSAEEIKQNELKLKENKDLVLGILNKKYKP